MYPNPTSGAVNAEHLRYFEFLGALPLNPPNPTLASTLALTLDLTLSPILALTPHLRGPGRRSRTTFFFDFSSAGRVLSAKERFVCKWGSGRFVFPEAGVESHRWLLFWSCMEASEANYCIWISLAPKKNRVSHCQLPKGQRVVQDDAATVQKFEDLL